MSVGVVAQGLSIFETLRRSLTAGNGSLRVVNAEPADGSTRITPGDVVRVDERMF